MASTNAPTSSRPKHSDGASGGPARFGGLWLSDHVTRARAYEKYLARGSKDGFEKEDWTQAQEELLAEGQGQERPSGTDNQ